MKWILATLLLFVTTACASDTINNSGTKASQMGDNGLELDVGGQKVKLEFFNINYKHIDRTCMREKLEQFDNMVMNHNFDMQKHIPSWRRPFAPGTKDWENKMILIELDKKKDYNNYFHKASFALVHINNIPPVDKSDMDYYKKHRKKPFFQIMTKSPYDMKIGEIYAEGSSREDIDFESCFK
jgi:hypothetical protein